ncbi:MAG TPA: glycosyltransferase family 39 protein [Thermoanaerobaculia bacterium]
MSTSERTLFRLAAAASLVLRAVAFFRYRFDADEQQHAHVAWGWTAGLVQYRDYFDNHAPLFHLLTAPWLALVGERPTILLWMRVPMLALFALMIWCTYVIGRETYDARTGAWAALLLSLFPPFFLKSLEFRTDNLWTALWLVALVLLVRRCNPFWIGLVLGAALAVSLKTPLLLVALVVAALFARRRNWWPALAGFVIVPAIVLAAFAAMHAWDAMVYCTVTFNGNLARTRKTLWIGRALFPFAFAAVLYGAWRLRQTQNGWRHFFAVVIGTYVVFLGGFWILISPRDLLPLMPLAAIFAAAALRTLRAQAVAVALCLVALWYYADGFANRTAWHTTMMEQALRLTRPGEPIIDLKGETIFRPRPFYYAFEYITRAQIAHGILRDTVAADVIRTRTHVAQADGPMWPPAARAFLSENFLDMGRLRASGQWLKDDGSFTIAVPGRYVIVTERGPAAGTLDGTPYTGARELTAGPHRFAGRKEQTAVVWAPAVERGHSPFRLRDREF